MGERRMEVHFYGVDFPHEKGEFCARCVREDYFLSCFSTPFYYEINGELLSGNPGDILLMPPGTVIYHGPQSDEEVFQNDWIYLTGEDFADLLKQYPLPQMQAFHIGNAYLLKACIRKMEEELLLKQVGYETVITSCITETVIQMYRLYLRQQLFHSPMYRIETVREEFLRHPERDWSLQEMASLCDYSVSRFCALYAQRFGRSPKAELLSQRLNLARQMLGYSEFTVTEIAERCGFKSIYYFSKYFKEQEGCSPREYAEHLHKNSHGK